VLAFVLALNNFAVPSLLLAASQQKVYPAEVWVRFTTNFDAGGALALSWPMIVVPLALLVLVSRRGVWWPKTQAAVEPKIFRRQLGAPWLWFGGAIAITLGLLSVGLPLAQLVSVKRTWTELLPSVEAGLPAIWNSFFLAAVAATVAGIIGVLFHRSWTRGNASLPRWIGIFLWLPFLIPGVLLGIAWIQIFNRSLFDAFYRSIAIVIFAFVVRYLAFAWNGVVHAIQTVDRDLTDAARVEGASRWQMLRHVHWPQIAPQVAATWYVIYLLCLWDVESIVLIVPPGGETLALRIFNLLHYGHNAQVNALCLTLLGLAIAPLLVWIMWRAISNRTLGAAAICVIAFALTGCSRQSELDETPVQSKIFSAVQIIGTRGVGVGQFNKPRALAVDLQDNLYVADITGRVQKFSPDGKYILQWQMPQTDLGKPKGMGRDSDGNIIVIEPHYQRVNHFTPDGKLVAQWGGKGTNAGQFTLPRAVALNSRKEIFVCEYTTAERVQAFSASDKKLLFTYGRGGTADGEFNRPEGLAIDAQDRIYVADSCNHRIQVFLPDGKWLKSFGKAGSGRGEFSYPYDVRVDKAGRIYVCEFGGSRIQIFDVSGETIEIIGSPGFAPGQFSEPWAIALDSRGNLYVADALNHRVQKFIRKNSEVASVGSRQ